MLWSLGYEAVCCGAVWFEVEANGEGALKIIIFLSSAFIYFYSIRSQFNPELLAANEESLESCFK